MNNINTGILQLTVVDNFCVVELF